MSNERLEALWRDPAHWTRVGLYRCARDPRLIVPKRIPWTGYTVNQAHGGAVWVWTLSALVVLGPLAAPILRPDAGGVVAAGVGFVVGVGLLLALCRWEARRPR